NAATNTEIFVHAKPESCKKGTDHRLNWEHRI
ncbi:unnamed protein product, partial [Allacma fusca]